MYAFAHWFYLSLFAVFALIIDLMFSGKNPDKIVRDSIVWTILWTVVAVLFTFFISIKFDAARASNYLTGYILERFLSFDNIFVFVLVFDKFSVPEVAKKKVLFWGIVTAIVLRWIFILMGAEIVNRFHWILYIFAFFLIYSGAKILIESISSPNHEHNSDDPKSGKLVKFMKKVLPISENYDEARMTTKINGKFFFTPLFLVACVIGVSDLVFALDSIPAVFGITSDPFIVLAANIFSLLGLRAIFFFIVELMKHIYYLNFAISSMLVFIGVKILLKYFHIDVSSNLSLLIISGILSLAIAASLGRKKLLTSKSK